MVKHVASGFLLAVLVALGIGSGESSAPSTPSTASAGSSAGANPSSSDSSGKTITGDNFYGCTQREYFEKLIQFAVQKDADAFKTGLAAGIATGRCTLFKRGERVHLADTAVFSGLVKVRRPGELDEYWTNLEAIN
jgi:hypothetical protein